MNPSRIAEVQYSPEQDKLEVSLPHGVKFTDIAEISKGVLNEDVLKKLRVACAGCQSGTPIVIRERFENVVLVDLNSMEVVEREGGFR